MSKALEALDRITEHLDLDDVYFYSEKGEKADSAIIEKELKALEIIKREPNDVIETITTYDTWEEYIKDFPISDKSIWHIIKNKSEFDLLKEVLECKY